MQDLFITNSSTILVIFGATGDLSEKKIIPSLWHLFLQDRLPQRLFVIGFSRRSLSGKEFKEYVLSVIEKRSEAKIKTKDFERFFKTFVYCRGSFEELDGFKSLAALISGKESEWGICANKLFYLAVPPTSYENIFKNIAKVKLNIPCGGKLGWSRILVEKPFGTSLSSARNLQTLLSTYFKEEQIYRIDHYLFKEIVQGIENFRFSNNLFENIWDNTTIDRIDLRLHEKIGAEGRGSFYDSVGAFRDVGQNHLLIMLAAITMEYPMLNDADNIRSSREKILNSLLPWTQEDIVAHTYRAQYHRYKSIQGVSSKSETETYFALKTGLLHPKWRGIPVFMEAGKRIAESRKEIVLTLKNPEICHLCEVGRHTPNKIIFRFEPNDEIVIYFWTKKPGFEHVLEERVFSFFLYEKETKIQYVEEYSKVLYYAMRGKQSLFISHNEVKAMWKFTDPVINAWNQNLVPLIKYEPDSTPKPLLLQPLSAGASQDSKEIGILGLGKMGANIAKLLVSKGWMVYGYNRSPEPTKALESDGVVAAYSLIELVAKLSQPRLIWIMAPHQAVDQLLDEVSPMLSKGDTVIDAGNSHYRESIRRSKQLEKKGLNFLDVGVSGGPSGARYGACLMIGGSKDTYARYENLFKDLSVQEGYLHVGKSGAGHFVKMIHNGIEYGMMQSIAEGFTVMKKSPFNLNLRAIAGLYNHGSVITSRLIGWLVDAYSKFGDNLDNDECCSGKVAQSGEGLWTVEAAKEMEIQAPVIEESVEFRKQSQTNPSYTGRIISALRNQFGGHNTKVK
jgi:6-phosphogluconate dehydrogenase